MKFPTTFLLPLLLFSKSYAQVNESGDSIKTLFGQNVIDADYPGGAANFSKFLMRNLNANVPVQNHAPAGTYTVFIQFIVDEEGNVIDMKPLTSWGYGMEEEAIRVLKKMDKWTVATQNGKPVKAYRKQPITFLVTDENFNVQIDPPVRALEAGLGYSVIIIPRDNKVKSENLDVTVSQGSIEGLAGRYIVTAHGPDRLILTVYNKKKELGKYFLPVRKRDTLRAYEDENNKVWEKMEIDPMFPGGQPEWNKFLQANLNAAVPVDNGARKGKYTVWIQFIVDKNGSASDWKALTNLGYGMEEEVIRVLKKVPNWVPGIQNGHQVRAYKKVPVTFVVEVR